MFTFIASLGGCTTPALYDCSEDPRPVELCTDLHESAFKHAVVWTCTVPGCDFPSEYEDGYSSQPYLEDLMREIPLECLVLPEGDSAASVGSGSEALGSLGGTSETGTMESGVSTVTTTGSQMDHSSTTTGSTSAAGSTSSTGDSSSESSLSEDTSETGEEGAMQDDGDLTEEATEADGESSDSSGTASDASTGTEESEGDSGDGAENETSTTDESSESGDSNADGGASTATDTGGDDCDGECGLGATCNADSLVCECVDDEHFRNDDGNCRNPCDNDPCHIDDELGESCRATGADSYECSCLGGYLPSADCLGCPDGQHSQGGVCMDECMSTCDGDAPTCVDEDVLQTCVDDCWVETRCGDARQCASGECVCEDGLVACDDRCVDPNGDGDFCGVDADCRGGDRCEAHESCVDAECIPSTCAGEIVFPDSALDAAVRDEIANLERVERVTLSHVAVVDLSPLSKLPRLQDLAIHDAGTLVDIGPLAQAKTLTKLELNRTGVRGASPVSELVLLTRISINNSEITAVPNLTRLSGLKFVFLDGNRISDIQELSNLNERAITISMARNEIVDVSPIATLASNDSSLSHVDLSNNPISTVAPLRVFGELGWVTQLSLTDSSINCATECGNIEYISARVDALFHDCSCGF